MPAAAAAHTAAATHTPAPVEAKQPGAAEKPAPAADEAREELMAAISRHIIEYVKQSPKPVIMANLADAVRGHFARELEGYDGWVGVPSFSGMLKQLDLDGLAIKNVIPGFVWDPQRHAEPNPETQLNPLTDEFSRKYPRIEPLVSRIHQLTDMPYLLPVHYAMILTQVARTVNEDGFQLAKTTRLVRDRCVERGAPVARAHVNFVVIGISYAGHRLGESTEPEQPEELAEYLYKNAINLCQTAQMVLTDEDKALVHEWLFTCLGDPSIN
jgi:hypothetical protein